MSLGGLALAIGVLVDAAIVMVENGYRILSERSGVTMPRASDRSRERRRDSASMRAKQVGPALFFSLLIIVVSFLRLPAGSAGRAHVPAAGLDEDAGCRLLVHPGDHARSRADGHLHPGSCGPNRANPISRITQALYLPVLRLCLRLSQDHACC